MDDDINLEVECSTITVEKPTPGERLYMAMGQPVKKAATAENLENRFKMLIGQEYDIHDKTSLRKNFLKKDPKQLKSDYLTATKNLNPAILESLKVVNYNVVAVSPATTDIATQGCKNVVEFYGDNSTNSYGPQIYRYLKKCDFDDKLNNDEKDHSYRAIRDYLFFKYTEKKKRQNEKEETQITKEEICSKYFISTKIPSYILSFLYDISCGNLKSIKRLIKLRSQLEFISQNIKPTVILADRSIHQALKNFFTTSLRIHEINLRSITSKDAKIFLFLTNLNSYFSAFLSINGPIPLSHKKSETLKKIMHGKKVNVGHPEFSGDLFIYNRIPFIYITDSHDNYNILKYQYDAKTIELSGKNVSYIPNTSSKDWVNNIFAALGKLLSNTNHTMSVSQPKIIEDNIISKFIKDICVLDKNADIPKARLFEVYQEYFEKNYGNTGLSKKKFNSKIAILADLDECRPHHNNKSNPRCFKGIAIDEDKYKKFLNSNNDNKFICDLKSFSEGVYEMIYKDLLSEEELNANKSKL